MKILMHICCGPCAVYPVAVLKLKNLDFTGYFYNPNIHPIDEYMRRMENVKLFADHAKIDVIYEEGFQQDYWEENFDKNDESRCLYCYAIRMEKAFKYAAKNGFDVVTTTLLVSPYQKHEMIIQKCNELSASTGVGFYYYDFREGFRKGQQGARDIGLYRQKYCGCILSRS